MEVRFTSPTESPAPIMPDDSTITTAPPRRPLIEEPQVAELLGISKEHVKEMRYQGYGPPYVQWKKKGAIRYRPEDVEEWIDKHLHIKK